MFKIRFFSTVLSKIKQMENVSAVLDRYIWMDLEMTGLDVKKDKILEVACIVTTPDLNPVDEGINLVVHQPEEVLQSMNDWCLVHHAESNLISASRESKISITDADKTVSDYIKKYSNDKGFRYIAGNSVYMDKLFIDNYMPITSSLLHYRLIDVSTVKVLCSHWYLDEYLKLPKKKVAHRALQDIMESINELKNFKKSVFKS